MVGLTRNTNGSWSARKRIPDDVREEYAELVLAVERKRNIKGQSLPL
jgi:hypothetical protein